MYEQKQMERLERNVMKKMKTKENDNVELDSRGMDTPGQRAVMASSAISGVLKSQERGLEHEIRKVSLV